MNKFKNINLNFEKEKIETHSELQKWKKPGRPKGSTKKGEVHDASITVSLAKSQKKDLEEYARKHQRSMSSIIKELLVKAGIINPV